MEKFKRGTLCAALVLSGLFAIGMPLALASEEGFPFALMIVALALIAIWGSRLGVNAVVASIFQQGQEDERGQDSDFV